MSYTKWIFDYSTFSSMSSGVLVGSIAEAKIFVVLGFCEVEGVKIPPLACLKFIISFCKYGITPPSGYREWERKQSGFRFNQKAKSGRI